MTRSVPRRKFIAGLAAAVVAAWFPFFRRQSAGADRLQALRSALVAACGSQALPANMGRACVMNPQPHTLIRDPRELIASFDDATMGNVGFADWFKRETISDFDAGRVVRVDGWVISETEYLLFSGFAASA